MDCSFVLFLFGNSDGGRLSSHRLQIKYLHNRLTATGGSQLRVERRKSKSANVLDSSEKNASFLSVNMCSESSFTLFCPTFYETHQPR